MFIASSDFLLLFLPFDSSSRLGADSVDLCGSGREQRFCY